MVAEIMLFDLSIATTNFKLIIIKYIVNRVNPRLTGQVYILEEMKEHQQLFLNLFEHLKSSLDAREHCKVSCFTSIAVFNCSSLNSRWSLRQYHFYKNK